MALEELQDLKGVWSELSKVWEQIDQMKEQPWVSVQPRKLRQNLDGLLNQLKNFPARLRQYASYEFVQRLLKGYLKVGDEVCSHGCPSGAPLLRVTLLPLPTDQHAGH